MYGKPKKYNFDLIIISQSAFMNKRWSIFILYSLSKRREVHVHVDGKSGIA